MQVKLWARNIASGGSIEITPPRPLHLTNLSISFDFRDAFAPTSLLLSVVLADRRTSPRYTVATLVAGHGIKYILTVNGPNALSILGYHDQSPDIGQPAAPNSHNFTFQMDSSSTNQNGPRVNSAPVPGVATNRPVPGGPSGLAWGVGPMLGSTASSTGNNQPPSQGNYPSLPTQPLLPSQVAAAENGDPLHGSSTAASTQAIKPLRHRQPNQLPPVSFNPVPVSANPSAVPANPSPTNPNSNDGGHAHASKRVKNGDGSFTSRYDVGSHEGFGHHDGTINTGPKRKATADSVLVEGAAATRNNTNARGLPADGAAGYSARPVLPRENVASSSTDRSRLPYISPHVAPPIAYADQNTSSRSNQAGPSQYRLPTAIHSNQKSTRSPTNDDSHSS
ncbi:hypothetical protein EV360DRAFT_84629 [Lentinula raphanica]|nr:hypothetical protein EV360DRAFT_84629 [Lentinula raphanica]